jgi:hypothetical protein
VTCLDLRFGRRKPKSARYPLRSEPAASVFLQFVTSITFILKSWCILGSMLVRVSILFVLFALAGGVVSGTPLHSRNDKMMRCCDKARSKDRSPAAEAARLCCATNCTNSAPISFGNPFNFTPTNVTTHRSIADQIAALFPNAKAAPSVSPQYLRKTLTRTFQPKYLQHNSFLI